jgi:hypothetical protein
MQFLPSRFPAVLRTMLLMLLVVGIAVRPALVMICELQGSGAGNDVAQLQADAGGGDHATAGDDGHPNPHSHGSHGVLQNITPDGVAAILPAFELPVMFRQPMSMPDMTVFAPPPQPSAQPFRPPIA